MMTIRNAADDSHVATVDSLERAVGVAVRRVDVSSKCLTLHVEDAAGKVAAVVTVGRVSYR